VKSWESDVRLSRLRQERELTQAALGRKVDVTEAYISMLERGQKKNQGAPILINRKPLKLNGVAVEAPLPQ
jgi:transcriptional regulator with XRE-family HTH domain